MPNPLSHLAKELEPFLNNPKFVGKEKLVQAIINHCNDPEYDRDKLIFELSQNGFIWFARKVQNGYYDQMAEEDLDVDPDQN